MQVVGGVLSRLGSAALYGGDLVFSSRLSRLAVGALAACLAGSQEAAVPRKSLPQKDTLLMAGIYGCLLTIVGTGGGRLPITGSLAKYVAAHALTLVADAWVIGHIATKEAFDDRRSSILSGLGWDDGQFGSRFRLSGLPVVALWFGLRVYDGWLSASMPVNTPPFVSLFSKLQAGQTVFNPLIGQVASWVGR